MAPCACGRGDRNRYGYTKPTTGRPPTCRGPSVAGRVAAAGLDVTTLSRAKWLKRSEELQEQLGSAASRARLNAGRCLMQAKRNNASRSGPHRALLLMSFVIIAVAAA